MYQFFVESGQIGKDSVMIEGSDVNHIKNVLRMKPGEKIRISGPARKIISVKLQKSRIPLCARRF